MSLFSRTYNGMFRSIMKRLFSSFIPFCGLSALQSDATHLSYRSKAEATLSMTVAVCVYLFCCLLNTSTHAAVASWHLYTFKIYFLIGINRSSLGQSKNNVYQILVISTYFLSFGWCFIDFHFVKMEVNIVNNSWRIMNGILFFFFFLMEGILTCYSTRGF